MAGSAPESNDEHVEENKEETTAAAEECKDAATANSTEKPTDRRETYFSDVKFSELPLSDQTQRAVAELGFPRATEI